MRSRETPVFSAIDESVSPDWTVYVRRRRALRRLELFVRCDVVRVFALDDLAAVEVVPRSSEDSSVAFTTL